MSRRPQTPSTRFRLLGVLAAAAALAAACGSAADDADAALDDAAQTAEEIVTAEDADAAADEVVAAGESLADQVDDPDLGTLFTALDVAGFDDIAEAEAFTFFAPNDSAFEAIGTDLLTDLLADPGTLRDILRDHLLDATVTSDQIPASATSTGGLELVFDTSGDTPTVNGIPIVRTDVTVDNGVIHVIDGILLRDE